MPGPRAAPRRTTGRCSPTGVSAWNLRDRHMADILDALAAHLGPDSRLVVWAHNAHIGDASASEQVTDGQLSLGQLIRERHGKQCRTIGFSTVTAATAWGGEPERIPLRPAPPGSAEQLLHDTAIPAFLLRFDQPTPAAELLRTPRLERTVGVVYTPATERHSHYQHTRLADRYDAVIYLDRTTALDPLDPARSRQVTDTPETFPTGL
ncbi:erythromycin esterase family protein [Nocardia terpenica]|nr:erythromycin esterase family protein [Nocardia terpenica]